MTKSTITRERLAKIKSWRETYGAGSNVMLPAEEAEELSRIALAAMDSEPVVVVEPSDYVTAAQLVGEGPARKAVHELYEGALRIGDKLYRHAQTAQELKPVGYLFVSDQGAVAYSPTNWGMPGFRLVGQIYGDMNVELQPAPVVMDERAAFNVWNNDVDCPLAGRDAKSAAWMAWQARAELACNTPVIPDRWIPVSEKLPERGDYLVSDGRDFDVQLFNGEQFIPGFVWEDKITHWMPLPATPQEVK
ncbi:DUF551 domain-containing protein [Klebsiella pneumoniae]